MKREIVMDMVKFGVLTLLLVFCFLPNGVTKERKASFWKLINGSKKVVKCLLCPRGCVIPVGSRGLCGVRENRDGVLITLGYGNPVAVHIDPIEKKPFFHVFPGAKAFSLAVAGCNMRCLFCQNWQISQSKPDELPSYSFSPEEIVSLAKQYNCPWVVYTYTEPTVFYEYMLDIAKLSKQAGLFNGMHTCGYINSEPLSELLNYIDAVNVDLKGFAEEFYQRMGMMASLEPVLSTLELIKKKGVWLEITNLVIPGFNDDPEMVEKMCKWIVSHLGDDVPLHFSRFYPHYKLTDVPPTPIETLERCVEIAKRCGLKYVYIGNVPGHKWESTYCPSCGRVLIKRVGYKVVFNKIKNGRCPYCGYKIAGMWQDAQKTETENSRKNPSQELRQNIPEKIRPKN